MNTIPLQLLLPRDPFCTVCKMIKSEEGKDQKKLNVYENEDSDDEISPPAHNRGRIGMRWVSTSEKTTASRSPILLKLFDVIGKEFVIGNLCLECQRLLDQIDAMEFQIKAMKEELKKRIDKFYDSQKSYVVEVEDRNTSLARPKYRVEKSGEFAKVKLRVIERMTKNINVPRLTDSGGLKKLHLKGMELAKASVNENQKLVMRKEDLKLPENHQNADEMVLRLMKKRKKTDDPDEIKLRLHYKKTEKPEITSHFWGKWTDVDHIRKSIDRGNLDYNFVTTQNERGERLLLYDDHAFHIQDDTKSPGDALVERWICSRSYVENDNCPCHFVLAKDQNAILMESFENREHNHKVDRQVLVDEFWFDKIVMGIKHHPDMTDDEIVETIIALNSDEVNIPRGYGMSRYVARIRKTQNGQ